MRYNCGSTVMIGDKVLVNIGPNAYDVGMVVAIGRSIKSDNIEIGFYEWALSENIINDNSIVISWVNDNPFSHNDDRYAPVGDYMTLTIGGCEKLLSRSDGE